MVKLFLQILLLNKKLILKHYEKQLIDIQVLILQLDKILLKLTVVRFGFILLLYMIIPAEIVLKLILVMNVPLVMLLLVHGILQNIHGLVLLLEQLFIQTIEVLLLK